MTMRSAFAVAAVVAAAFAAPALARTGAPGPDAPSVSVTVPLGDLNLHTEAGAETALRRISAATRQTCGDLSNIDMSAADRAAARRCRQAAVDDAVAKLNQPAVTAQAKTGTWARLADH